MSGILDQDATIAAANRNFRIMFDETLTSAADMRLAAELATVIESNSTSETYSWLGAWPSLKPWMNGDGDVGGERVISKLREHSYTIKNLSWANAIEVDQDDYEDEKLPQIGSKVRTAAIQAAAHYVQLLVDLLANGFTQNGYDGVPFFSAAHPIDDGATFSNVLTATLDDSAAYDTAFERLLSMTNANGDPIATRPTHLIVGPSLRRTAMEIIKAEIATDGSTNVNSNSAQLIVSPRLVGPHAAKWFLADLSRPMKPLVLQIRKKPMLVTQTNLDDPHRFMTGRFRFGVEGRHNAGYGLPQYIIGSNGTT